MICRERLSAALRGDLVALRTDRSSMVRQWLSVAQSMRRMTGALSQRPQLAFLPGLQLRDSAVRR